MPIFDDRRPGTFRDFYRPLRTEGCGWFTAGAVAAAWVLFGVKVERST